MKKVTLNTLKVKSFITNENEINENTVKGGLSNANWCNTAGTLCGYSFRCSGITCPV